MYLSSLLFTVDGCFDLVIFSGDDGVALVKNEESGVIIQPVLQSTIAEEAVDQLQASEKLIAGMWKNCF